MIASCLSTGAYERYCVTWNGPAVQTQRSHRTRAISISSSGECVRGDTGIPLLFPYWAKETFLLFLCYFVMLFFGFFFRLGLGMFDMGVS